MQDCATHATDVQKHSVLLTWIAPCNATDVSFWYVPDPSLDKSLNWCSESHKMNWSRGTCDNELKKSSNLILRSNVTMDLRLYRVKYPLHALMTTHAYNLYAGTLLLILLESCMVPHAVWHWYERLLCVRVSVCHCCKLVYCLINSMHYFHALGP